MTSHDDQHEGARADTREAHVVSWELFCRVVDNYGDIGVGWRLARQLASDPRRSITLRVDDLRVFARIEPRVQVDARCQCIAEIEVVRWDDADDDARSDSKLADVVVELFGCGLPQRTTDAMARASERAGDRLPIWIDLEYLSAEAWVDDFHRRPSPHPTLPLVKHFFYPGFSAHTGGVLIEHGLDDLRRAFLEDADEVDAFWRRLQLPPRAANERRASLFAYPGDALKVLLDAMTSDPDVRWTVVVPEGVLARKAGVLSEVEERGRLSICTIPFVSQDDYDRMLWSCDVNFVRGEDSFVRAQWAARPFVWHIYPQADDVHLAKLDAFADRYEAGLPQAVRDAQRALWHAWNAPTGPVTDDPAEAGPKTAKSATANLATAWARWRDVLPELAAHAEVWRQSLASRVGLVDSLTTFVAERRADLLK